MSKWKMKSIKHSGARGERGTERQEPFYLARNRCEVEFELEDVIPGQRAVLYYAPKKMYDGNGILVSTVIDKELHLDGTLTIETKNSIYEMECMSY